MKHCCKAGIFAAGLLSVVIGGCGMDDAMSPPGMAVGMKGQAWRVIQGECLVTFFSDSGREYHSEQIHRIEPMTQAVEVTATEPEGMFRWKIRGARYESSFDKDRGVQSPVSVIDAAVLRAIVTSSSAFAGCFDKDFGERLPMVKNDGQWYRPVEFTPAGSDSLRVTLLESADDGATGLVLVEDRQKGETLIARAYNGRPVENTGRVFPTRIDVLRSSQPEGKRQLMLRIQYQNLSAL